MRIDRQELHDYYASLSDEELAAVDRDELTGIARNVYDEELAKRRLTQEQDESPEDPEPGTAPAIDDEAEPDWLESAACAIAFASPPGGSAASDADTARDVLEAAGIPSQVSANELVPPRADPQPQYEYRVMVPGARSLEATSVLERELFNPKEEADWRAHFQALSDKELRALKWEAICAGLRDRMERLKSAYDDEISRRRSRGA